MKIILFGDSEHEPIQENIITLANDIYSSDLLVLLFNHLSKLEFEVSNE